MDSPTGAGEAPRNHKRIEREMEGRINKRKKHKLQILKEERIFVIDTSCGMWEKTEEKGFAAHFQ